MPALICFNVDNLLWCFLFPCSLNSCVFSGLVRGLNPPLVDSFGRLGFEFLNSAMLSAIAPKIRIKITMRALHLKVFQRVGESVWNIWRLWAIYHCYLRMQVAKVKDFVWFFYQGWLQRCYNCSFLWFVVKKCYWHKCLYRRKLPLPKPHKSIKSLNSIDTAVTVNSI